MLSYKKKLRIRIIFVGLFFLLISSVFLGFAFKEGIEFYKVPTQILQSPPNASLKIRMGGLVEKGESVAHNLSKIKNDDLWFEWGQFIDANWDENTDTAVKQDQLIDDSRTIADVPNGFILQKKVKNIIKQRIQKILFLVMVTLIVQLC